MAVRVIDYPVKQATADNGRTIWKNIFPSKRPLHCVFERKDTILNTCLPLNTGEEYTDTSGNNITVTADDNIYKVSSSDNTHTSGDIKPGNSVTFLLRVRNDLTKTYVGTLLNASGGSFWLNMESKFNHDSSIVNKPMVLNWRQDYRLEIRYRTIKDNPDVPDKPVIDSISKYPSDRLGLINADISLPGSLIRTDLENYDDNNLSVYYRIQWREMYLGVPSDREYDGWLHNSNQKSILLVYGSEDIQAGYGDESLDINLAQGYPIPFSFIHTAELNPALMGLGAGSLYLNMIAYDITSNQVNKARLKDRNNNFIKPYDINGVVTGLVDLTDIPSQTVFIRYSMEA